MVGGLCGCLLNESGTQIGMAKARRGPRALPYDHCSLYCADLADLFYLHAGTRVMTQVRNKSGGNLIQFQTRSCGLADLAVCVVLHGGCRVHARRRDSGVIDSRVVASDRTTRTCNFGTTTRSRCFRARPLPAPGFCPCRHGSSDADYKYHAITIDTFTFSETRTFLTPPAPYVSVRCETPAVAARLPAVRLPPPVLTPVLRCRWRRL